MSITGFEFAEGPVVEMWSAKRLPYGPKEGSHAKKARDRLRAALDLMTHDTSLALSASYTSLQTGRAFDIENVLGYNVGMAAFARTGMRGICFERVRAAPPLSPSGQTFEHHHAYKLARLPPRPTDGVSLTLDLQSTDLTDVARVWWAVSGARSFGFASRGLRPITGRFTLHVEIGLDGRTRLYQVVKGLVDGIVAGLQNDPAPSAEAVIRLSRYLSRPTLDVADRLARPATHLLIGDDRLVRPFHKNCPDSLQWHPVDHRCESIATVATGSPGLCTITMTEIDESSS